MAASHTLPHSLAVSQIPRHGVLVLHGFGIKMRLDCGHLFSEWGVGSERYQVRLSRVEGRKLRRVVLIGSDGYCSLEALRFISDVGAAFVMLDRRGKVLAVCGPTAPSDARLRRAQCLALTNGTALRISKELIRQKLNGQATLVRDMLRDSVAADAITRFREELPSAESIESVRMIEAQAAKLYWQAWSDVPIRWLRKDERRVPKHWKRFGARISPLTHSPRLAADPPNAILNLLYSVLESESRLAAVAMGLDPGIGLLHVDTPSRDSLACDLMEAVRPAVDAFLLNWIQTELFSKKDYWEDRNGNCRLSSALAIKLCSTADTWRGLVAPVAEFVAQELSASIPGPSLKRAPATRLTQQHKREAKGSIVNRLRKPPRPPRLCRSCGASIASDRRYCWNCGLDYSREQLVELAKEGRVAAQTPDAQARRAETKRRHDLALKDWSPSSQPDWLTQEVYVQKIQPKLAEITVRALASAIDASLSYAGDIRAGRRRPHPRHWQALAELVGISPVA